MPPLLILSSPLACREYRQRLYRYTIPSGLLHHDQFRSIYSTATARRSPRQMLTVHTAQLITTTAAATVTRTPPAAMPDLYLLCFLYIERLAAMQSYAATAPHRTLSRLFT